jgi:hypothetical protein
MTAVTHGIDTLIERSVPTLSASLGKASRPMLDKLRQKPKVYISFLRSGILCKTPLLRLDFCGENIAESLSPPYADWDVPEISTAIYREADMRARQRENQSERVKDYEIERLWLEMAEEIIPGLERRLPEIVENSPLAELEWSFGAYPGIDVAPSGRYFKLEQDKRIPYGVLLSKTNDIGGYHKAMGGDLAALDDVVVSFVRNSSSINFYPDILDRQLFMVKGSVKEVFDLFLPELEYKHCIVLDNPYDRYEQYFIPMLDVLDLEKGMAWDNHIFFIAEKKEAEAVVSLDVAEATLRRKPEVVRITTVNA